MQLLWLRAGPSDASDPITLLIATKPFDVIEMKAGWVSVRQAGAEGWIRSSRLWELPHRSSGRGKSAKGKFGGLPEIGWEAPLPTTDPQFLQGFGTFAFGNAELSRKMSHPFYRHRIAQISSNWGPLFYRRTRLYYVKGIDVVRLDGNRIRLRLVKRRIHYKRIFGEMWTDDFMDNVLKSNSGWLGNRSLFRRGREYFLELSYHF